MMRIPTFSEFQRQVQKFSREYDEMARYQEQIESGNKLINDSDDPVLAAQIRGSQNFIGQMTTYDHNGILSQGRNALFETVISNAISAVSDLKTQVQAANNGTVTDWSSFANRIQGDLTTLLNVANTQDANQEYLFSGSNTTTPAYMKTSSGYQYQGSMNPTTIDIGLNVTTTFYESGYNVFGNIPTGNGSFSVSAANTNTGSASTDAGSIDPASYVPDTYTISFITNTAGNLAVKVVGASSGQVIPTSPQDAPAYVPGANGMDLKFNGVNINIVGPANVGDSFQVQPSVKQNAFDSIQNLLDVLKNPPANKGQLSQSLTQGSAAISQILDHLTNYQSKLGTNTDMVNKQVTSNKQLLDNQKIILSNLKDVDLSEVFANLSQQSLALQATQEGFIKIQQTLSDLFKM